MNIVCQYIDIQDCNASPDATFYARNSTNSGNNTNWGFSALTADIQSGFMTFLDISLPTTNVTLPLIPRLSFADVKDGDFTGYVWAAPIGRGGNIDSGNNTGITFPLIQ